MLITRKSHGRYYVLSGALLRRLGTICRINITALMFWYICKFTCEKQVESRLKNIRITLFGTLFWLHLFSWTPEELLQTEDIIERNIERHFSVRFNWFFHSVLALRSLSDLCRSFSGVTSKICLLILWYLSCSAWK